MGAVLSHRLVKRSALLIAGFFAVAIAPFAKADQADVSLLYVEKTQRYVQTASTPPPLQPNPFTINIGANRNPARPNAIASGTVQIPPPVNTISPLTNDGTGNFILQGGNFADVASLNASFPNGSYAFTLQTTTNPATPFTNSVNITGDNFPTTVPRITGATFASGGLQVDPSQNYTISWQAFVTPFTSANTAVILQIVDGAGTVVFSFTTNKDTSTTSIPAGRLQPGQFYTASLTFQNRATTFAGTFNSGISVYSARTDFTIATIGAPPVVSGPSAPVGMVGQLFVYQIIASNNPFAYGASALPPNCTLNPSTGIISGIPQSAATVPATLTATNIDGQGTKTNFQALIQPTPATGPIIISSTSASGFSGQPFSFQVATRNATPAARITATGLPTGLTLDPVTGKISGATNAVGSFSVNLSVSDGGITANGFVQLTFTSDPNAPVITNADTVLVAKNQPFNYKVATPGATSPADPVKYAMLGTLPPGLGFDAATGTISGTFTGSAPARADGPDEINLTGGVLGTIQLFSTNSHGTATFQLLFLAAPSGAVNISTRLLVGTGENVLIGGFIITGNAPKVVIIRGMGPSTGVPGAVQDPVLELHNSIGGVVMNDNWRATQEQIIKDTTIPPPDDREAAIVISLDPGNYTAIVSGKNGTTGIGLVEVFDLGTASLDSGRNAQLAQISTRGRVLQGDDVMIGGFIVSSVTTRVIARAIGPSLVNFGIANALANPTLELFNGNGTSIGFNDDWKSTQEQAIRDTTVPPPDDRESAIVSSLAPSAYTVIVRGQNNTTGIALVEVFSLP